MFDLRYYHIDPNIRQGFFFLDESYVKKWGRLTTAVAEGAS